MISTFEALIKQLKHACTITTGNYIFEHSRMAAIQYISEKYVLASHSAHIYFHSQVALKACWNVMARIFPPDTVQETTCFVALIIHEPG